MTLGPTQAKIIEQLIKNSPILGGILLLTLTSFLSVMDLKGEVKQLSITMSTKLSEMNIALVKYHSKSLTKKQFIGAFDYLNDHAPDIYVDTEELEDFLIREEKKGHW